MSCSTAGFIFQFNFNFNLFVYYHYNIITVLGDPQLAKLFSAGHLPKTSPVSVIECILLNKIPKYIQNKKSVH